MAKVGESVSSDLELASIQNEIVQISQLFHGAEAVIIFFVPYCYGELSDNSMETLLIEVSQKMDDFDAQELKVACITK